MSKPDITIEDIEGAECRRLLSEDCVGRVAVIVGATPMVFPVNYALDGDDIVMRTRHGSHLDVGQGHAAFEVDSFDRTTHTGWTVLVTGYLEEVEWYRDVDIKRLSGLNVSPWAPGDRNLWLRLRPQFISGRVIQDDSKNPSPDHKAVEWQIGS